MVSTNKIKSVEFYRKIPGDLTKSSLSGAGLSIIAAFSIFIIFGMALDDYLRVNTSTSVVVDKSSDGDFLRIDFNMSFPALACEFASVEVSDILGTRLNVTKTIRKYSIDSNLNPTGSNFWSKQISKAIKHGKENGEEDGEGSIVLNAHNFHIILDQHAIVVVNFYASWCYWSKRLKPSWEKAAAVTRERYDPEMDGRILLAKVNCTEEVTLCKRNHIRGYPSIRIFRNGSNSYRQVNRGYREYESYYGERDSDNLVKTMEDLVAPISLQSRRFLHSPPTEKKDDPKRPAPITIEDLVAPISLQSRRFLHSPPTEKKDEPKRPAPITGGCRIEGFVRVKKVPGNLIVSARSAAHSFDASQMNMSHFISHFSFGKRIIPRVRSAKNLPYLGGTHGHLNGLSYISNPRESDANVTIEHYLQVVKTEVLTSSYKLIEYEYTAKSSLVHSLHIPVAKFYFEPSPMQVLINEDSNYFAHFLTEVCALLEEFSRLLGSYTRFFTTLQE